ncbi:MAG TPA: DUF4255 domain-containing protein [Thermoanaerobaculia bacterium]
MALPVSSLSQVCRSIADFLANRLEAPQNNIQVRIGSPASAAPIQGDNEHRVNLFFYRVEPNGYGPAAAPDETWMLRLSCLVTTFGVEEDQISPGENDLRLLGSVLSAFHERPILDPVAINGTTVRPQVVFQPLGMEEINHLWATQGEVAYRPSVAYEMALIPVLPRRPRLGGPLVGAIGFEVRSEAGRHEPFGGQAVPAPVVAREVNTRFEDWAPTICFVTGGGCVESVSLAVGTAFAPQVWVAGLNGVAVRLRWEIWDGQAGWRPGGAVVDTAATGPRLDPDQAAGATTTPIAVPFNDHAGQAVLYAERTFNRAADGAQVTVRSNPLLVNFF